MSTSVPLVTWNWKRIDGAAVGVQDHVGTVDGADAGEVRADWSGASSPGSTGGGDTVIVTSPLSQASKPATSPQTSKLKPSVPVKPEAGV